jgi:hypothetical protein
MKGDMIPGGKGDKSKPSDFDHRELAMGIKVEMEHTKSRRLAREIAMDHLSEDPRYYTKLKKVHAESTMNSFEELLQRVVDVYERLAEASPPPFKAQDRAAAGMKPLKTPMRSGAKPPPIPSAAMKAKEPSADTKSALADIKKPAPGRPTYGTKGLGITRSFASGTAKGGSGESKTKENVAGLSKVVAHRAKLGESLRSLADECRAAFS